MLYMKDNITYHTKLDITKLNDYTECQFIKIHKDSTAYGKNIIVGVIYRPPCNDTKGKQKACFWGYATQS